MSVILLGACADGAGGPGDAPEVFEPREVAEPDAGGDQETMPVPIGPDGADGAERDGADVEGPGPVDAVDGADHLEEREVWESNDSVDTHDPADGSESADIADVTDIADSVEIGPGDVNEVADTADGDIAGGPPLVSYTRHAPRRLFFLNNPEQLLTTELGDSDLMDATLLRVTAEGPSRSFFEHVNKSGRTIGFGVQLYNPGPAAVTVTVEGVGYVVGIQGGIPFSQALSGQGASAASSLGSGQSIWILRRDESVPNGSFFSGVVDYTVTGGAVIVNHIAYDRFDRLDGSTAERDYVTRIEPDGTSEARMYKGVCSESEALLALELTLGDDTPSGPLPVTTRRFDLEAKSFGPPRVEAQWVSHIGPSQNAAASVTDMVSIAFRAWNFDPLEKSDAEGKYPNLGNWGVVYRTRVVVRNLGTRARTVTWRLWASPGAGAGLAKRAGPGSAEPDPRGGWTSHQLAAGASLDLTSVVVPAGSEMLLEGAMVLGGPSGGALRNALVAD